MTYATSSSQINTIRPQQTPNERNKTQKPTISYTVLYQLRRLKAKDKKIGKTKPRPE